MTAPFRLSLALAALVGSMVTPATAADAPVTTLELDGRACDLIPVEADAVLDVPATPIGIGACPGVRPGAQVRTPRGSCTFNFVFDGSDGRRYIGTAGHCILSSGGERIWSADNGPVARDSTNARIGEFAYAALVSPKDFALIRLDEGVEANPAMCHFGGPTEINDDLVYQPTVLHHFGQGLVYGDTVPGRTHLATKITNPNSVFANGLAIFGDSGSGVISGDGRAIGVLVTGGVHMYDVTSTSLIGITRIAPQVARAEQQLGISLTLATAAF